MAVCSRQRDREARRVLRHLEAGRLEPRGALYVLARKSGGKARLSVTAEMVAAFQAEGWISLQSGGLALSDQGRAWLTRQSAAADPFRTQHGEVIDLGAGLRQERAASSLDALGRLMGEGGRPYLGEMERAAAQRLETDFEQAHLRPRLTLNITAPRSRRMADSAASETLTASALDARRRVMAALDAAGPGLKDMLFEIVCLSQGLNEAERALGWPQRSGKAVVRLGLQRLAEHYGLASGRRRPGRIEAWMEAVAGAEP